MIIELSTGNFDIIDYGTVLLFDEKSDLTIKIAASDSFRFSLTLSFLEKQSEEQKIEIAAENHHIKMECVNFAAEGTGMTKPAELAKVDGKSIYFSFWTCLQGQMPGKGKVRKVDYTVYREQ